MDSHGASYEALLRIILGCLSRPWPFAPGFVFVKIRHLSLGLPDLLPDCWKQISASDEQPSRYSLKCAYHLMVEKMGSDSLAPREMEVFDSD